MSPSVRWNRADRRAMSSVTRSRLAQPPNHLVAITGPVGLGQPLQVAQDVREHQPRQVRVLDPGGQDALDRRVRAVAQFAELVDRLPVAVSGQASRPRSVLQPVQQPVVGEVVEPVPQAGQVAGDAVVVRGQFGQHLSHIVGMGLRHVGGAQPIQGAQHPEVGEIVLPPGEAEQAEPIADCERVEVERISLVIGNRHRDEPLPVHVAVGAYVSP